MTLRVSAFRLTAALAFVGLGFGAAPAQAQIFGCGYGCGGSYIQVQPAPQYYYSSGCGGCGSAVIAPPRYYYYTYGTSCGGCGTAMVQPRYYYPAPAYVAPQPTGVCADMDDDGNCADAVMGPTVRSFHRYDVEPRWRRAHRYVDDVQVRRRAHRVVHHKRYRNVSR